MKVKEYGGNRRLSLKGTDKSDYYTRIQQLMEILNECPTAGLDEPTRRKIVEVGWNLIPPLR